MNWLHHHRDIIAAVIAICAVGAVILIRLGARYARAARYERYDSRHAAPQQLDFYGDTSLHDTAWDQIADELGDDYATESCECGDPYCSQFTHTGELPALRPLPAWEADLLNEIADRPADCYESRDLIYMTAKFPADAPPTRRHGQWTSLLGGPDLAEPIPDLPVPDSSRSANAAQERRETGDGELQPDGDVLEGVVVTGPLPGYGADDWREFKEWLDASFAESWAELAAWSARQLEAAA